MRVSIDIVGDALPFGHDVEGVAVPGAVVPVLVHPVPVVAEEVRVVDELSVRPTTHPVEHGVETDFANAWKENVSSS